MLNKKLVAAGLALALASGFAQARDLKSIGITVGSLGNPFFVTIAKGAEAKAKALNPDVKVLAVSADYDLNKQFTQIDNFIASGVDMILLNAADARAIEPAVKKAQKAGIVVVGVDVAAAGADAVVGGDLGCLLNIEGRLRRRGDETTRVLHFAEVLAGEEPR